MASSVPTGGVSPTGFNWLTGTYPGTTDGSAFMDDFQLGSGGVTLPDGVVDSTTASFDVEMSREATSELADHLEKLSPHGQYVRMVDHSWLENVEPDPRSIPKNPYVGMLEALQEAWGTGKHTNGLRLVPNKGPVRKDWNGFDPGPHSWLPQDQIKKVAMLASRQSHMGKSWEAIESDLKEAFGPGYSRVASELQPVKDDHGLAGKVFIREASFPGILNGKFDKVLSKLASARYVLVEPTSKYVHLQRVKSLDVVTEVPWVEACKHYLPRLKSAGVKVASDTKSPKEMLRAAFLSTPTRTTKETMFQTHKSPSEQITLEEAKSRLASHVPVVETFKDPSKIQWELARKKTAGVLTRWVREGVLAKDVAHRLMASYSDADTILSAASELIRQSGHRVASYSGHSVREWSGEHSVWEGMDLNSARVKQAFDVRDRIVKMANEGSLSKVDAERILRHKASPDRLLEIAVRRASSHKAVLDTPSQASSGDFKGNLQERTAVVRTLPTMKEDPETARITRLAKTHGVSAHEIQSCVSYTRRMASSGVLGYDLNRALKSKFSAPVLKASQADIQGIRKPLESGKTFIKDDLKRVASRFNQVLTTDASEATNDYGLQNEISFGFNEVEANIPFEVQEFGMFVDV